MGRSRGSSGQTSRGAKRVAHLHPWVLVLCFLFAALGQPPEARALPIIRACFEMWPPYQEFDIRGQPRGVALEVTRDILRDLGYETHFNPLPYERCVSMTRNGEMDMIVSSGAEPGLVVANEHKVVWVIGLFMSNEQAPNHLPPLSKLGPLTVGYAQQFKLPDALRHSPFFRFDPAPDDQLNFRKLASGRIDAVATDVPWAFGLSSFNRRGGIFVPPALAVIPQPDAFRPGLESLRDAYSRRLERIRDSGRLDKRYAESLGRTLSDIEAIPVLPAAGFRE